MSMSCDRSNRVTATAAEVCANCGKEGTDGVKLKNCTACLLVKYCGTDCQKIHRKQHKKACKKRAAELKDEKLYGQGHERPEADFCPLCLLAIPIPMEDDPATFSVHYSCCMKSVCDGCCLATYKRGLCAICPFCRAPRPEHDKEILGRVRKRVAAKDPESTFYLGCLHYNGLDGLEKDESRGIELWSEAAELGSIKALYKLGVAYHQGFGVAQDKAKGIRCWESAAMLGCVRCRYKVGLLDADGQNYDRAVRHFLISAKMGHKDSLDAIKEMFAEGLATKAQYAEGLKGYQDAVEEMKSPERDEAAASDFLKSFGRSREANNFV